MGTASEATLVALLTARSKAVTAYQEAHPEAALDRQEVIAKLVAYGSNVAHSSVERAGMLGGVKMRLLEPDQDYSLRQALYFCAWIFLCQSCGIWKLPFYPRLDKCHRRSQIFPVSFADFDSSEVLVAFSAFIFW